MNTRWAPRLDSSTKEDEIAAQSSGIPLAEYKSLVFAIGGFIQAL